ncbi:MAG: hypothetical protein HYY84_08670 [Deltaproteobacteria bacterium]|nr:hypothetical protein [Deltaproteobacteria bacterium]
MKRSVAAAVVSLGLVSCTNTTILNTMEMRITLPTSRVPNEEIASVEVVLELAAGFESRWGPSDETAVVGVRTAEGFQATTQIADVNANGRREFTLKLPLNPFGAGSSWPLFLNSNPEESQFTASAKVLSSTRVLYTGGQTVDTAYRPIRFFREGNVVVVVLSCAIASDCDLDGGTDGGGTDAGDAGDAGVAADASVPVQDASVSVDLALVRLIRNPVGTADRIEGADASASAGALVTAYRDLDGGASIGSGTVAPSGAFAITLTDEDVQSAAIRATNGDASTALSLVTQKRLVATFAGKDAGSTTENPHVARWTFTNQLQPTLSTLVADGGSFEFSTGDYGALASSDATSAVNDAGLASTGLTATKLFVDARRSVGAVYRPIDQSIYIFGGNLASDVWTWNGFMWFQVTPTDGGPPSERDTAAVAYDRRRDKIWVFGGCSTLNCVGPFKDDLWEFHVASKTWTNRTPVGDAGLVRPAGRIDHAMAFDERNDALVLFGGTLSPSDTKTWVFSPDASTWTAYDASVASPTNRAEHAMVFWGDAGSASSRVILHGGYRTGSGVLSDTYLWDGNTKAWSQPTPTSFPDAGRRRFRLTRKETDPNGNPIFLFGGIPASGSTWPTNVFEMSYNPGTTTITWKEYGTTGIDAGRLEMAWATRSDGKLVIFGGYRQDTTPSPMGDTLVGTVNVSQVDFVDQQSSSTRMPPALFQAGLVYDATQTRVVLATGRTLGGAQTATAETWIYDTGSWTRGSDHPAARWGAVVTDDPVTSGLPLLFGGNNGTSLFQDTYLFSSNSWSPRSVTTKPAVRWGAAVMTDPQRSRVVVFGGCGGLGGINGGPPLADTWEWDGTNWSSVTTTTAPPARSFATFAYDSVRRKGVLYGGDADEECDGYVGALNDTWEFDGTGPSWTQVDAGGPGDGRKDHAAVFDSRRGRVVMHGGRADGGMSAEVFEYDGVAWTQLGLTSLTPHEKHSMTFDHSVGEAYIFGGVSNDFWKVTLGGRFAEQLFQFNVAAAGVTAPYGALRVKAVATGSGARGTTPSPTFQITNGVYVFAWNASLSRWDAVFLGPGEGTIEATIATTSTAQYVSSGVVSLLVATRHPSSTNIPSVLAADFIELSIDY